MRARVAIASVLACALMALLTPARAHAGPWTPEPAHGYLKAWLKWNYAINYLDGTGAAQPFGGYQELFASAYGEVGLVDGLAATLHMPVVQTFYLQDPRDRQLRVFATPGDPTVSLRWRAVRIDRIVGALEVGTRLPFAPASPLQTTYAASDDHRALGTLVAGAGVVDVRAGLSAGYSLGWLYFAASAMYVFRSGDVRDVLTWTAEAGAQLEPRVSGRLRLTGWHPITTESAPPVDSPSGLGNDNEYIGFAVEAEYAIEPTLWIGATIEGGVASLRRLSGGPVVSLFVATKF